MAPTSNLCFNAIWGRFFLPPILGNAYWGGKLRCISKENIIESMNAVLHLKLLMF